jgi:hypothetical protein
MAMEYDVAARLTGELYGNILQRDADHGGYNYYVDGLANDDLTLQEVIAEFFVSEEFREKFIANQTPNELARNLLRAFFGYDDATDAETKRIVAHIVESGFPATIRALLADPRYLEENGQFGIPRYIERAMAEG